MHHRKQLLVRFDVFKAIPRLFFAVKLPKKNLYVPNTGEYNQELFTMVHCFVTLFRNRC